VRIIALTIMAVFFLFASVSFAAEASNAADMAAEGNEDLRPIDLGDDDSPATRRYGAGETEDMQPGQVYDQETGMPDTEPNDAPYTLD
jgi:hypothetical protein